MKYTIKGHNGENINSKYRVTSKALPMGYCDEGKL